MKKPILIAGAGLSGLSAARALPPDSYLIFDKESEPGGLCRSIQVDGYTFDYTGHLLHLKGRLLEEVEELLGDNLEVIERKAKVFAEGKTIDYPFQLNFHDLSSQTRDECLEGFRKVADREVDRTNFATWCRSVFGEGIYGHFMKPYNEKLYRTPLEKMSADWIGWIPRPTVQEMERSAGGEKIENVGYNAVFRYPKQGGIGALPAAQAEPLDVMTSTSLVRIDSGPRRAVLRRDDGVELTVEFERLISTVPLPLLLKMIDTLPVEVSEAARDLEAVGVYCLNLGIDGPTRDDVHWMYFPEPEFPFFRVGFYHNISPTASPAGKSSLYVEVSYKDRGELTDELKGQIFEALSRAGILDDPKRIETCIEVDIDAAYGLHTPRRAPAVAVIKTWLETIGIHLVGRYGRWAYTSMGEALSEGKGIGASVAKELNLSM